MEVGACRGLLRYLGELKDPRVHRTKRHLLPDILTIAICAVICGADGWTQIAQFGRCKWKWFKTFLELPNGTPSPSASGLLHKNIGKKANTKPSQKIPLELRAKTHKENSVAPIWRPWAYAPG